MEPADQNGMITREDDERVKPAVASIKSRQKNKHSTHTTAEVSHAR
jgi:hypothetical protein